MRDFAVQRIRNKPTHLAAAAIGGLLVVLSLAGWAWLVVALLLEGR